MLNYVLYILITGLLITGNGMEQFSSHRQLLIFGNDKNQHLIDQQLILLNQHSKGVKERAIKITVLERGNSLFVKYNVSKTKFTVLLVGKDGTEKYRTNSILQMNNLFSIIDAMPMRKAEMLKENK